MIDPSARRIGGSDAAVVMHGSHYDTTVYDLWEQKIGRKPPPDLSRKLPVQIGVATEWLNCQWYQHETGNALLATGCMGLIHPKHDYMTANLDGRVLRVDNVTGIFEAKHIGAFSKTNPVETYYPQLQHYLSVTALPWAHLSWFQGTDKWAYAEVTRDDAYIAEMIEREAAFWFCVESQTEPPGWAPVVAPEIKPARVIDLTGNNQWAVLANEWIETRAPFKRHEVAVKQLKGLIEPDVSRAFGHGIEAVRDGRGLTIKESAHAK